MSTTGRTNATAPDASEVAARLDEAGFVRLVGAATGDGLAASGVLARALAAFDRPFQVSLAPFAADATRGTDADLTVAIGRSDPAADLHLPGSDQPASETVLAVVRELGQHPVRSPSGTDPASSTGGDGPADTLDDSALALALAGVVADGRVADSDTAALAREAGFQRRPGLAIPTTDVADGLAHSTLVHAPFSGDVDASRGMLTDREFESIEGADLSADDRRRLASFVALDTVGPDDVPPRGGEAVERFLRPFAGGPVETIGGFADLLDAVSREQPGTGVALALGHDVATDALEAWRTHAARAHAAVRNADSGRYDGLFVVRPVDADAPVGTVARLVHCYRSPEPVTLVATAGSAAAVADGRDLESRMQTAAAAIDGTAEASASTGRARYDADAETFVTAFREVQE